MAFRYGIQRPNVYRAVVWDGTNLDEVKDYFNNQYDQWILVNPNDPEDTTLYYGMSIEDSQQFPAGTLLMNMGGFASLNEVEWDSAFQTVDTQQRVEYDVTAS